jgi:hypothetical protein
MRIKYDFVTLSRFSFFSHLSMLKSLESLLYTKFVRDKIDILNSTIFIETDLHIANRSEVISYSVQRKALRFATVVLFCSK